MKDGFVCIWNNIHITYNTPYNEGWLKIMFETEDSHPKVREHTCFC